MTLTPAHFEMARDEILASQSGDILAALHALQRQIELHRAEHNHAAWAAGRKGDGAAKITGLTDTLTTLLRRFAACGIVRYTDMPELHRHVSALRKRLKDLAPSIKIDTIIGEGYELVSGFDEVMRLVRAGPAPSLRIANLTPKQVEILRVLALRGSAHVEQIACLQRHVSNLRAKLSRLGLAKAITIVTAPGEGLYVLDEAGRDTALRLLAGEITPKTITPKRPIALVHSSTIAA